MPQLRCGAQYTQRPADARVSSVFLLLTPHTTLLIWRDWEVTKYR